MAAVEVHPSPKFGAAAAKAAADVAEAASAEVTADEVATTGFADPGKRLPAADAGPAALPADVPSPPSPSLPHPYEPHHPRHLLRRKMG